MYTVWRIFKIKFIISNRSMLTKTKTKYHGRINQENKCNGTLLLKNI